MGGEITAMEALFTTVTTVITNLITLLGTVSTALLSNEIFQLVIGIVVFTLIMGVIFYLVKKLRRKGK